MTRFILFIILNLFFSPVFAENNIQKLYKRVNNSVVELHVKSLSEPRHGQMDYKPKIVKSLGSGALINKVGRILTAAHVVDRATEIEVVFADGSKTSGHVVWIESLVDLAMIQALDVPDSIKPLKLAAANDYSIGEQVVVIGAPYGVSHSLSVGYLSGIRDSEAIPGSSLVPRLLQTDAAINMGNSGGPMFNLKGEVIGIVSHILSKTGGNNGLGFVISVDNIHTVIDSNPSDFFGLIPLLLNKEQSKIINNSAGYGMLIQNVIPNTLADRLGFKGGNMSVMMANNHILLGGDILLEIDGIAIKDVGSAIKIKQRMARYKKGEKIPFKYLRNGVKKEITWVVD
ncbi:MAG: trypsin-like peptidase domain-containing protein [Alteromonadaceae bacterium]|nr:trypsin-like peptidase domain-containing protein [Alteromonadaceae bacterium]PCI61145.1 MAG: trypsin [Gammaproteobacteria bacterium]